MKVGYLGPKATFSYEACVNIFRKNEIYEFKTITDIFKALQDNKIDKGVVPIENSIQGGVTETIDSLIINENVNVVDEYILKISQNLMGNKNYSLEDIHQIYSHPQALAQCRNYLEQNLPNAETVQTYSTALAAKEVSQKDYCACIGSKKCLEEFDLKLIKDNIQDNNLNQTRFWIITLSDEFKKINKKMSLIFSTKDKPGALYYVLGIFNKYNINLTRIESRPAKTILGEYIFLIDLELNDGNEELAIKEINENGFYIRCLGKY